MFEILRLMFGQVGNSESQNLQKAVNPVSATGTAAILDVVKIRILIADDNRPVREGLRRLLTTHAGWEICGEAENGQEAVRQTGQLRPDVIVLDFSMPGMNGIEAARKISEASPSTAVLLCSMYLDSQLARLARAAGISAALSKSNVRHLIKAVEAVLRGDTFFASQI